MPRTTLDPMRSTPGIASRTLRTGGLTACVALLAASLLLQSGSPRVLASTDRPVFGAGGGPVGPGSVTGRSGSPDGCPGYCDDGNVCTHDSCNDQYECTHTPISCDDGLNCTDDSCHPVTGCAHAPRDCSSGSACITNACDEATGECVFVSRLRCGDRNVCTEDICDPDAGCLHAPVPCHDDDPCTRDYCDRTRGCVHVADACFVPPRSSDPGTGGGGLSQSDQPRSGHDTGSADTTAGAALRDPDGRRLLAEACGFAPDGDARGRAASSLSRVVRAGWPNGPGSAAAISREWQLAATAAAAALGDDAVCLEALERLRANHGDPEAQH